MKTLPFLAILGLAAAITACATAGNSGSAALDEANSDSEVFGTPTPAVYTYSDAKPGYNDRLAKSWEELPPAVPHRVEEFLPVVIEDNQCLDCHDVPKYIGKPLNTDRTIKNKSPMSKEHYANSDLEDIDGARFNCTQCHVPLSDAPALVESTYH
jgi:cytochrome c-type protein NapB